MALSAKRGFFNTTTAAAGNTVVVTGLGFQPKAIEFWWNGRTNTTDSTGAGNINKGFGTATGTSARSCVGAFSEDNVANAVSNSNTRDDACILTLTNADAIDGLMDLQSIDADGFTMVIDDAFASSYTIHYLALGGVDITNVANGTFNHSGAAGTDTLVTPGFVPDYVIVYGSPSCTSSNNIIVDSRMTVSVAAGSTPTNAVWCGGADDSPTTMLSRHYSRVGKTCSYLPSTITTIVSEAVITWDGTGFTVNWDTTESNTLHYKYLAIKGGRYRIGSYTTATDSSDMVQSGFGFNPKAALFFGHGYPESAAATPDTHDIFSFGAFDSASSRSAAGGIDLNGIGTSQTTTSVEFDGIFMDFTGSDTTQAIMDIKSVDNDGFTTVMDLASTATFIWYTAYGNNIGVTASLLSADATIAADVDNVATLTSSLLSDDATLAADVDVQLQLTSSLLSDDATLAADVDNISTLTSSLLSEDATLAADVIHQSIITSSLLSDDATIAADVDNISTLTSSLLSEDATLAADVDNVATLTSSLLSDDATLASDLIHQAIITSSLLSDAATIAADMMVATGLIATLISSEAFIDALVFKPREIESDLVSAAATILASVSFIPIVVDPNTHNIQFKQTSTKRVSYF